MLAEIREADERIKRMNASLVERTAQFYARAHWILTSPSICIEEVEKFRDDARRYEAIAKHEFNLQSERIQSYMKACKSK